MEITTSAALGTTVALEDRTARLTILIDPRKTDLFERLCAEEDATPSQLVQRLIRRYIEERTGKPWTPAAEQRPARRTHLRRRVARQRSGQRSWRDVTAG
jgi:hypothetical protein